MPALVSGSNTQICFSRLTWAIDNATHHCNLQRDLLIGKCKLSTVSNFDDVDFGSTATWAGNEVDVLAFTQTKCFQQLTTSTSLFYRIGREAVTNGVANAFEQQRPNTCCRLQQTTRKWACLGYAEMQRVVGNFAELTISLDHQRDVGCLDRDFDEIKINLLKICNLLQSRFDHCLCRKTTVLFVQGRVE